MHFLLDLGLGGGENARGLRLGIVAGLLHRLTTRLLALGNDLRGASLCLGHHPRDLFLGAREALATLLACGEAVGDLLLACTDRPHQHRPDERRAEPDEDREEGGLHQEREIHVHKRSFGARSAPVYLRPTGISGFAYANNMAIPRPMMNEASISPTRRKTLA